MAEKRGVNKKIKTNLISMNNCLHDLDLSIDGISSCLKLMMGITQNEDPVWNGNQALKFYKKAVANLRHDIDDYNYAAKVVEKLAVQYEILINKDRK